jgi:hypothetical protein
LLDASFSQLEQIPKRGTGGGTLQFTLSRCFAARGAYDRERADLSFCDFGIGERRLPQGILTCGICANPR